MSQAAEWDHCGLWWCMYYNSDWHMVSILLTHDMQQSENILEGESGRAVRKYLQGLLKKK